MPPKAVAGRLRTAATVATRQAEQDATERAATRARATRDANERDLQLEQEKTTGRLKSWKIDQMGLQVKDLMGEISRLEARVVNITRERHEAEVMKEKYHAIVLRQRQELDSRIDGHAHILSLLTQCFDEISKLRTV